jgi:hypothetical protein
LELAEQFGNIGEAGKMALAYSGSKAPASRFAPDATIQRHACAFNLLGLFAFFL